MKVEATRAVSRALLACGLLFGAAAAHAASGYSVTENQESRIHAGMTAAEVQRALGTPERNVKYPSDAGPTWTYRVTNAAFPDVLYDVNFGANGKVASTDERTKEDA